jgi:hypothetical protein
MRRIGFVLINYTHCSVRFITTAGGYLPGVLFRLFFFSSSFFLILLLAIKIAPLSNLFPPLEFQALFVCWRVCWPVYSVAAIARHNDFVCPATTKSSAGI